MSVGMGFFGYVVLILLFGPIVAWLLSLPFKAAGALGGAPGVVLGIVIGLAEVVGIIFLGRLLIMSMSIARQ